MSTLQISGGKVIEAYSHPDTESINLFGNDAQLSYEFQIVLVAAISKLRQITQRSFSIRYNTFKQATHIINQTIYRLRYIQFGIMV
jgi:hypothetical protein